MFELELVESITGSLCRYRVANGGATMEFQQVLNAWLDDHSFRKFFSSSIVDSGFPGLRWETPPLTRDSLARDFEFALINSPSFCCRKTDPETFRLQFSAAGDQKVITFKNIGGDATMVVPVPLVGDDHYGHLASFLRGAPDSQVHSLWQTVANRVWSMISDTPIWLNTAGGGVAWLHVRIDSRPKYYSYGPYQNPDYWWSEERGSRFNGKINGRESNEQSA